MAIKRRGEQQTTERTDIEYVNLEAGEHEGRLRYVADLGMQKREYMGEEKPPAQQLALGIEIIGQSVEIDGKEQPRLLWTSGFNVFHELTERGKELQYFKVFDQAAVEGVEADWDSMINEPCNVVVIHTKGKGDNSGRTYDNIDSLTPIPTKYKGGVEAGLITNGCTGDADDMDNPAQASMFGLPLYIHGNRIDAPESLEELTGAEVDIPF